MDLAVEDHIITQKEEMEYQDKEILVEVEPKDQIMEAVEAVQVTLVVLVQVQVLMEVVVMAMVEMVLLVQSLVTV